MKNRARWITVIVVFCVFGLLVLGHINSDSCTDGITAYVMSKDFVKRRLISPSTAEFPSYSSIKTMYLGECKHEIRGYVDAQNPFGATIRNRYYVKLQKEENSDYWKLLKIAYS